MGCSMYTDSRSFIEILKLPIFSLAVTVLLK